ncbi:MAG: hypothetical protein IJO48_04680 [Clostridia bacterium]|nr:hypothetical protein [Clostridia bacterium]
MKKFKCVIWSTAILLLGSIMGFLLLCGVFLLPTEPMFENAKQSSDIFVNSEEYPYLIDGYKSSILDIFTDSLMINHAVISTDANIIESVVNVYHTNDDDTNPVNSLVKYLESGEYEKLSSYERYWHGYLVTLKPMLLLFDYGQIRLINLAFFAMLGVIMFMLMWKKASLKYAIGLLVSVMFTMPLAIPFSLQFCTIMYITLLAVITMLVFHEKFAKGQGYIYFFLIVGMVTSYMDYLTYPLAALGIPMVVLILLSDKETLKQKFIKIIGLSACFGVGYLGMWALKWIIGGLLTGSDVIGNAVSNIALRTSSDVDATAITFFDVVAKNFSMMSNMPFVVLATVSIAVQTVLIAIKRIPTKEAVKEAAPFMLIACMPFAWQFVTANHSYIHAWFTFRVYWITAFACMAMLSVCFQIKNSKVRVIDKIIKK